MIKNNKKAFTLSETLIVLTVLGIISALVIPQLMIRYQESMNRMKIKKAMTVYDGAIAKMTIENDLKTANALKKWANQDTPNCDNPINYFKTTDRDACTFRTSDGVWWDIEDITEPLVAVSKKDFDAARGSNPKTTDGKKSFKFITSYDVNLGTFRVNDLIFEKKRINDELAKAQEEGGESKIQEKIDELEKLFGMIGLIDPSSTEQLSEFMKNCVSIDETHCKIGDYIYEKVILTEQSVTEIGPNTDICVWDRDAADPEQQQKCGGFESKVNEGDIAYFVDMGKLTTEDLLNQEGKISGYTNDYWQTASNKCTNGTHLATLAELKALKDIGKLSSGSYWSSTEYSTNRAMFFTGLSGSVYSDMKYNDVHRVICVGN